MEKTKHPGEALLYEAMLSLKNQEECRAFLDDICTIKEIHALFQRMQVASMLDAGCNYQEVINATGASSATISRVSRCLNYGTGYQTALERMKKEQ